MTRPPLCPGHGRRLAAALAVAALSLWPVAAQGPGAEVATIELTLPLPADLPATASFGEFRSGLSVGRRPDGPAQLSGTGSALYRYDPERARWDCLGKEVGPGVIDEGVRRGGTVAVLRDTVTPSVQSVQARGETRLGARRLVFPVREVGEGFDVEDCQVAKDGEPMEAEYDPDRRWGQVWLPSGLAGRRAVTASCRDRAGNRSALFHAMVSL